MMEQLNREPTEEGNRSGSLVLIDLENLIQDNKEFESGGSGLVSPRELTKINFRSLIGHTDEIGPKLSLVEMTCWLNYGIPGQAKFYLR